MAENMEMEPENSTQSFNIIELAKVTIHHWPWIILSVFVCVGLAMWYVLTAQPVYERSASIIISDNTQGSSISSELSSFVDMGFVKTNSNIIDEINNLSSPDIMTEVIKRLDLMMNYSVPGKFHRNVIYGTNQPVKVELQSLLDEDMAKMKLNINTDGTYELSDLRDEFGKIDFEQSAPAPLDSAVVTPFGSVIVKKTNYYRPGSDLEVYVYKSSLSSTITKYSKAVNIVRFSDDGNTIEISLKDASPLRADDIIEALISIYNERWMDNRNMMSVATSNFISERLRSIEHELGNVDKDISSYQSEHLIPDVQAAASMFMQENQEASAQIMDLNNSLQMTRYMRDFLSDASNRNEVLPVNTGIGNASIENQILAYNDLLLKRAQYGEASGSHPHIVALDNRLSDVRAAIIAAIDNQIVAIQTKIKNLQSTKSMTTAQLAANPTQAKYLLSVERQQKVKESLYLFLLQKREENELSQAFIAYNTRIIASPHGPKNPVAPRKMRIIAMAFLVGLLIPFGVQLCLENFNTKVRGRKDLENLSVPLLGEVPSSGGKSKSKETGAEIVVKAGNRNAINEAFRVLRTNINFMSSGKEGADVIMVSSFNVASGKSFIILNLAATFALRRKKVLIIDGDLRHATTSSAVGSPSTGLSDYLVGHTDDIQSLIVKYGSEYSFDVLPVGKIPPNPTELLETDRLSAMIEALRNEYDYILIDCPPAVMMADAHIINQVADRTIFVIRAGLLERSMLPEIEKLYQSKRFNNLCIVLNDTSVDNSNGFGYGHGYGDYGSYRQNG